MADLTVHSIDSAPEAAKPLLEGAKNKLGFIPNLFGVFAEAPSALKAYLSLSELFGQTSFSPTEQQVVLLSINFENNCEYCMGAHSVIAGMQGVPGDVITALREGTPIADPKLEALRVFAAKVTANRGWVSPEDTQAFLDAGYEKQQILEVLLGASMKTLSNYTNHIAKTPLDGAFASQEWKHPDGIASAAN